MPESPDLDPQSIRHHLEAAVARVCPRWLRDQREDIVQEAMIRVMKRLQKDDEGIRSRSYLWRVAYSATVEEIQRARRRANDAFASSKPTLHGSWPGGEARSKTTRPKSLPLDEPESVEGTLPGPPSAEQERERRDLGGAIANCLSRLAAPRKIAVLADLNGYKRADSAQFLGWNPRRYDNLRSRGLADLRRCLAEKGFGR